MYNTYQTANRKWCTLVRLVIQKHKIANEPVSLSTTAGLLKYSKHVDVLWINELLFACHLTDVGYIFKTHKSIRIIAYASKTNLRKSIRHTHNFVTVNFKCVKLVVDKWSLALQVELVWRPTFDLADGLHLAADVWVTIEGQGHLLCVARLQLTIQWQDVKYLSSSALILYEIFFVLLLQFSYLLHYVVYVTIMKHVIPWKVWEKMFLITKCRSKNSIMRWMKTQRVAEDKTQWSKAKDWLWQ